VGTSDLDPALAEFRAAKTDSARAAAAIRALENAPRAGKGPARPTAPLWPETIRNHYFPPRRGAWNAFASNPLDVAKLSKAHRRILELLCEVELDGAFYANAGLPPDLRSRRRLLGLDPPSVLEDRVKGKARWKILREALDKYRKLKSPPPIREWLGFDLDARQWVELWSEVCAGAYNMLEPGDALHDAQGALTPAERHAWASKWLGVVMNSPDRDLRYFLKRIIASFESAKEKVPAELAKAARLQPPREPKEKPPEQPKRPGGKYEFSGKNVEPEDFDRWSAIDKKQFLVAAAKYAGKSFRSGKTFVAWGKKELDGDIVDVKRWVIRANRKAVFEMWTFLVDNGTVFPTGSAKPSGVHMIQGDFKPEDKRPASQELAEELQADVPF
jgi:hypothetical protein